MIENTYLVNREKKLGKKGKRKQNLSLNQVNKSDNKCFFFFGRQKGHIKKSCPEFKANWLEKKGNLISLVCYESNMVHISYNTRWINSSTTMHVANTMQSLFSQRKPTKSEHYLFRKLDKLRCGNH